MFKRSVSELADLSSKTKAWGGLDRCGQKKKKRELLALG